MTILRSENFDALAVGNAAGFVANAGTWAVGTTNPVSAPNSFGSTSHADGDFATDTSVTAFADGSFTFDQVYRAGASLISPSIRSDAGRTTGILELLNIGSGGALHVDFYQRAGSGYTLIASSPTILTLADLDVLHCTSEAIGTKFNVYLWTNSNTQPSLASTTITTSVVSAAGYPGFYSGGTVPTAIDNYVVKNNVASSVTINPASMAGTVGTTSAPFSVAHDGSTSGADTITLTVTAGATVTPTSLSVNGSTPATFTVNATTPGNKTITATSSLGLTTATTVFAAASPGPYITVNANDARTGTAILVLVPSSGATTPYNSANPTRVVLYCHGAGDDQTALISNTQLATIRDALINAGYILAASADHGDSWGSQPSVDDVAALDQYVRANYNVSNVVIWSQSMGGLAGLLALAQNKVKSVLGWFGTFPVCDLSNMYAGSYQGSIKAAYGITGSGNSTYGNLTYGQNPILMNSIAFRGIPMRATASPGDTVVNKTANIDALRALVSPSASEFTVIATTGDHGDPSNFTSTVATDMLAFFQRCFASPAATSGLIGGSGTYPNAAQVLNGVAIGNGQTGNVILPTAAQVQSGVTFGSSGSLTGTYASGGGGSGTYPTAAQVLLNVTFGPSGAPLVGNYVAPSSGQVQQGVQFGPMATLTGTLAGGGSNPWTIPSGDGSLTYGQKLDLLTAILAGKSTGQSTAAPVFYKMSGTGPALIAALDQNGNRISTTLP